MTNREILSAYLPMDRCQAIVAGDELPDRVYGAALFADISGFTPLTAALAAEFGRQRGAELVLDYINPIYEALIGKLHDYRGSVIGFAGDSITCWLDGGAGGSGGADRSGGAGSSGGAGRRAVTCALAMQQVMRAFATITTPGGRSVALAIKIGIAAGPARRFLVGNPAVHNFEALAGATLERMAAAEGQAQKGEVIASREVIDALGKDLVVSEWRAEGGFAAVSALANPAPADPWPPLLQGRLPLETLRAWIDDPVIERLEGGAGFLAELRPVTALFIRFSGIDYDGDDAAGQKLDIFLHRVQQALGHYDGYLLQLTIGDKGSNLLAVFGAPVAHDDDEQRCVAAALDLRQASRDLDFIQDLRLGISQGLAWAGAVGGQTRCIYSVMGDEVNMAARLMGKAAPGQILVAGHVAQATGQSFQFHDLGRVMVKGKEQPISVAEAVERRSQARARLSGLFHTPLVGREQILADLHAWLRQAWSGEGATIRLEAPAGVGKSHLAAVLVAQAAEQGWQIAPGLCSSIDQRAAYTPWRQAFEMLLGLTGLDPAAQVDRLQTRLESANPDWALRLPLMGDLLGLAIPDTPLTASLEPRQRRDSLTALVVEILRTWAGRQPLLIVLEDVHWIDEVSAALTVMVARGLQSAPAILLVVQRPPLSVDQPILPELDDLGRYHRLELGDLTRAGIAVLAENRLGGPLGRLALDLVWLQAQGNPFFSEELLDALQEAGYLENKPGQGWELSQPAFDALLGAGCLEKVDGEWRMVENPPLSAAALDIPDSVQGAVLARLDRLPEAQKLTLKVASVIGRTFALDLLRDVHPLQPEAGALHETVELAGRRDFVRLENPGDNPVYIFKHNTSQEVAYSTLLFAQRQDLHGRVGGWYEQQYGDIPPAELTLDSPLAPHYSLLAHHWQHAERPERERHYAGLAGEQAAKKFANESAVRYFGRALDLAPAGELETHYRLLTGREAVLDVLSDREAQEHDIGVLEELAQERQLPAWGAAVALRRARLADLCGEYEQSMQATQAAVAAAQAAQDALLESKAYHQWGRLLWKQGQPAEGREKLERGLELALQAKDHLQEGRCYSDIANTCDDMADPFSALAYYQRALTAYQTVNYRLGEINCLVDMSAALDEIGRHMEARQNLVQALAMSKTIGWRGMEGWCLANLGSNAFDLGDYTAAKQYHEQALIINRETGRLHGESVNLDTLGLVYVFWGEYDTALDYIQEALRVQELLNDLRSQGYTHNHMGLAYAGLERAEDARLSFECALRMRKKQGQMTLALDDLAGLARLELAMNNRGEALDFTNQILTGISESGLDGAEFPAWIFLTCARALAAAGQSERASAAKQAGRALVMERAAQIQDEALRRQFLEQVPFNRHLLAD